MKIEIVRKAEAGSSAKSDALFQLSCGEIGSGIRLDTTSKVMSLFGGQFPHPPDHGHSGPDREGVIHRCWHFLKWPYVPHRQAVCCLAACGAVTYQLRQ